MKKILFILLVIFFISSRAIAFNPMVAMGGSGCEHTESPESTCDDTIDNDCDGDVDGDDSDCGGPDCSGTATFIWDCTSETVTDDGCSDGDTSADGDDGGTSAAISSGKCVFDTTGGANQCYYAFDNGADVLSDDTVGTVFIKFQIATTWVNYTRLFHIYGDANDEIYGLVQSDDDVALYYQGGNGTTDQNTATAGAALATGTYYIARFRWRTSDNDPNLDVYLYTANCGASITNASNNTNLDPLDTQAGNADYRMGQSGSANATDPDIDYVHHYAEWRDTDPNGDCSSLP